MATSPKRYGPTGFEGLVVSRLNQGCLCKISLSLSKNSRIDNDETNAGNRRIGPFD